MLVSEKVVNSPIHTVVDHKSLLVPTKTIDFGESPFFDNNTSIMYEDIFPIEHGDFPVSHVRFQKSVGK